MDVEVFKEMSQRFMSSQRADIGDLLGQIDIGYRNTEEPEKLKDICKKTIMGRYNEVRKPDAVICWIENTEKLVLHYALKGMLTLSL